MWIRRLMTGCLAAGVGVSVALVGGSVTAASSPTAASTSVQGDRDEPFRPQLHYSPAKNWMNDPNGLVYYKGEYHLFYQYNPEGAQWGNMSWGHAVSRDLVHWKELPVAIPYSDKEWIFSGSAVVDWENTSGFGSKKNPPMVAIYTSVAYTEGGEQSQALAYSTDRGRTWTKYKGNPVLEDDSNDFRDPKVFWYEKGGYWLMVVARPTERQVEFYRSDNLKDWKFLSDFGPANAVGGIWECPDLFQLPVDGDPQNKKWVLSVSLNPGAPAGGSGTQYFVGEFDGKRFSAENVVKSSEPPSGKVFEDFESSDYGSWKVQNDTQLSPGPFGESPARGTLPGQLHVDGYLGDRLVNSFVGGDAPRGTLTSPDFTINEDYVNFLVGGGNHPHVENTTTEFVPPESQVIFDFETPDGQTYEEAGWTATGDLQQRSPEVGPARSERGHVGRKLLTTFYNADRGTGTLTSPEFVISRDHLSVLTGAGGHDRAGEAPPTVVDLIVDGEVVRSATGNFSGYMNWRSWNVSDLVGERARIRVVDQNTGGWGHLLIDHVIATDEPVLPRSIETAVNLIVDGEVVRTATGKDSEYLDWTSWDVSDLTGQEAHIEIVDHNSGGWGHINVDHIMFADQPARSKLFNYDWLDYGADNYAAISWANAPGDRRLMIGWMNNWQYAGDIPTGDSRGSMALPRRVKLQTIDGEVRLTQQPVKQIKSLHGGSPTFQMDDKRVAEGVLELPERAHGTLLEITAEFEIGSADEFGLHVRAGTGERTVVGYDVAAEELFVDRTDSGTVEFNDQFPGVHRGPLSIDGNRVRMTLYVDRSSVEVFGGKGQTVITDRVFPKLSSDGVSVYAKGGDVTVRSLSVRPLRSIWR